jgi:hypothetical protein
MTNMIPMSYIALIYQFPNPMVPKTIPVVTKLFPINAKFSQNI